MVRSADSAKRMLIVDDSATVRRILGRMLVDEGFSVDIAGDGIAAQDMLGKNEYDIVLVDLRMPTIAMKSMAKGMSLAEKKTHECDEHG